MPGLNIDAATWTHLNRLLDQALELPVPDRAAWIESLDGELESLKPHLRELLAHAASVETGDFLETLPKFEGAAGDDTGSARAGVAGECVGAYRLIRELGSGGMGSVWLADRTDGLIKRPVALKLPHLVAARRAGLAERMAREREILATLDHRNIAKLIDAGVAADGQPFLALEYVEGIPIDRYCAGGAPGGVPGLASRLRLFRQVAEAVAYAHGKLVVHRDLKPSNILVAAGGGVKLLDFGIAKLLSEGEARETRLTEMSGRALTPDYASPEQILGEPLTVASDVYSLGVILFEILSGARPYRLKRDSRGALEDAILVGDAPRMSQIAPAEFRKALRGDLDTIVAKALKKNPAERYATVNALADDLSRYLENRPVRARADSQWYRLRKFVTRNRLAVVAGAVVMCAVVAGAGLAWWQARVARAEQARADTVKKLIVSIFERADPNASGGKPMTVGELLQQSSQSLLADPDLDALVRAEVANVLGKSLVRLRNIDAAEPLARASLIEVAREFPPSHIANIRARLLVAEVDRFRGNSEAMREQLSAVMPLLEAQQSDYPDDYVRALKSSATQAIDAGDYEGAVRWATRSVETTRRRFGETDDRSIDALQQLALAQVFAGNSAPALDAAQRALARAEQAHPGGEHPLVIETHLVFGRALNLAGDFPRAIEQHEIALAGVDRIWGPGSIKAGFYAQNLAQAQINGGQLSAACDATARAVSNLAGTFNPDSYSYVAMWSAHGRARLYARRGAEALQSFERIAPFLGSVFGDTNPRAFDERAYRALATALAGDPARAEELANGLLADFQAAGEPKTHRPFFVRARIARLRGDPETALKMARAALAREESLTLPWERAAVQAELAYAQISLGDAVAGEARLRQALALLDQAGHLDTPERTEVSAALSTRAARKDTAGR